MARQRLEDHEIVLVAPVRERVFERILDFFKQQLTTQRLKPGDRLRSEREMGEALGVSRPSLREALRALEMLGLVEIRHGQGAFMRAPEPSSLAGFIGLAFAAQPSLVEGFLEVRIALECEAVRMACTTATDLDLQRMETALRQMPRSPASGDHGATADFEFHAAIVQATRNGSFIFMYEAIEELLRQSHEERRAAVFGVEGALDVLARAHEAIYQAIADRDEDRAVVEMRHHFNHVRDYYVQLEEE